MAVGSYQPRRNASTGLSMNGKSPTISSVSPFLLKFSEDEFFIYSSCSEATRRPRSL